MDEKNIVQATEQWLDEHVIGLNLCPFAQRERRRESIEFCVSTAMSEVDLLTDLERCLNELCGNKVIETMLLIHPQVLGDFVDYNQFLAQVDGLLKLMGLEGVLQVASFHPDYQFADALSTAAENYTNRSPYPMLHILREASIESAIMSYASAHKCEDDEAVVNRIIEHNVEALQALGSDVLESRLQNFKALGRQHDKSK